jgi:hypothetical protein
MGSELEHDVLNEAVDDLPALIHTWRVYTYLACI